MREIKRDFIQSYKEPFSLKAAIGQSLVAFAAGVLAGLGHAPFSLIYLSLPGFAAVFWLVRRAAAAQNSANPPAIAINANGANHPWRATSTRNGSTIQNNVTVK